MLEMPPRPPRLGGRPAASCQKALAGPGAFLERPPGRPPQRPKLPPFPPRLTAWDSLYLVLVSAPVREERLGNRCPFPRSPLRGRSVRPNNYLIYWGGLTDPATVPPFFRSHFNLLEVVMCFVTRSSNSYDFDDSEVFLYCFEYGFFLTSEIWLSFCEKFELKCINEHPSPTDPSALYKIYVCPLNTVDSALSCIKAMYL